MKMLFIFYLILSNAFSITSLSLGDYFIRVHHRYFEMTGVGKLVGDNVLNKSDEKVDLNDDKYKDKVIGLYFSAHW